MMSFNCQSIKLQLSCLVAVLIFTFNSRVIVVSECLKAWGSGNVSKFNFMELVIFFLQMNQSLLKITEM